MVYSFRLFDPRPQGVENNNAIFGQAGEVGVLGIEVTVPELAARCVLGNIDPQHSEKVAQAAIEVALVISLPPDGATLATVKPDLDSIGAMALLEWRRDAYDSVVAEIAHRGQDSNLAGVDLDSWRPNDAAMERIRLIAEADRFAHGTWQRRVLPSQDNPWPEDAAQASDIRRLAAIMAAISDFKVPAEERVAMMQRWLETGEDPSGYRDVVEAEREEMIAALEHGDINITVVGEHIAAVESAHRAALMLGYAQAPVVVALNPAYSVGGNEPHPKFTVAQYQAGHVDLQAVMAELQRLEPGWGGSPTIIGSPQGIGSVLTIEQVVEVVEKHMAMSVFISDDGLVTHAATGKSLGYMAAWNGI